MLAEGWIVSFRRACLKPRRFYRPGRPVAGHSALSVYASSTAAINRELIAKAETIESPQRVVLNMDSTEIPVYG